MERERGRERGKEKDREWVYFKSVVRVPGLPGDDDARAKEP